jgi:DNA helicase MCM8
LLSEENKDKNEMVVVQPRFHSLDSLVAFEELKAEVVGQLVGVRGHAVKVGSCRSLLLRGAFRCAKCQGETLALFEDGIFAPPIACTASLGTGAGGKCGATSTSLEFKRSSAVTEDYQRIKLQEVEQEQAGRGGPSSARVPRTFEVEVRASLVNLCIPGDLITVVGIVKTVQVGEDTHCYYCMLLTHSFFTV